MTHSYGRIHSPEAPSALFQLHRYSGASLVEVDHEPPLAVLEQENFDRQGIDTSVVVPGAPHVLALGNCVLNAGTVGLSGAMPADAFFKATAIASYEDTRGGEEFAIRSYHGCTDQTGTPDQEWPPTDCGSSGPYLVQYFEALGVIGGQQIAHGPQDIVSLLQSGGICQGTPFFNAWEEPDAGGFIDGDGSASALQAAINSGVAGGHETFIAAIEKLVLGATGMVDTAQTILRVRNSWGASWGDHGSFRLHLSTLEALGSYCDFRQFVPLGVSG